MKQPSWNAYLFSKVLVTWADRKGAHVASRIGMIMVALVNGHWPNTLGDNHEAR
ncbi:hypothetical protein FHR70_002612 [Microvirga lupini]|uniref:Uncharacterized protein n=1 Tax=Microvirga lupini TaxID=420324 RepID=A0A7W4VMR9_9HYPH|nr:hypothetical protein [Microvirga lupini]